MAQPRHGLKVDPPELKILLYTDDPDDITPKDSSKDFGLVKMIEHLEARHPAFSKFCIKWVSRNSSNQAHADEKLDEVLERERQTGHPFEELWFFGMHQANKKTPSHKVFRGGPESELTQNEVSVLKRWMTAGGSDQEVGGGILMTGDHNHKRPEDTVPSTNPDCPGSAEEPFLGRGRAIGRCVPRAGKLRKWEGEPTNCFQDSHNTIVNSGLQTDRHPQDLIHVNVDASGTPHPEGQPHPIFRYKTNRWIDFLPDHAHEGRVVVPEDFDDELWPNQIRPHVVAKGVDRRYAELVNLIMSYNGDLAGVGRIVADSSWHHYFNINVRPFSHPAPEDSPADQIGQYYANLAIWLAPFGTRHNMGLAMLWRLANYTVLMEPLGDIRAIGKEANSILSQIASPCEIHETILALIPPRYGALSLPQEARTLSSVPSQELILGCVLDFYHEEMIREEQSSDDYVPQGPERLIEAGFNRALMEQHSTLQRLISQTQELMPKN